MIPPNILPSQGLKELSRRWHDELGLTGKILVTFMLDPELNWGVPGSGANICPYGNMLDLEKLDMIRTRRRGHVVVEEVQTKQYNKLIIEFESYTRRGRRLARDGILRNK